ncbi:MAG: type I glyceraldehyde-3-phosphate dehydrogenase [Sphingomonadales bacterium]|nr:type I glyceraldehyde-3-phosphate dehydrogenase [Sphingomonadales bacterium]
MTVRVAINGFGRIGRLVMRAIYERDRGDIEVVAINDLGNAETNAHLLKYDSVHGQIAKEISVSGDTMTVGGAPVKVLSERDPGALPWGDLGVDIALECTGLFTAREKAALHLDAGAKKVLISAPGKEVDLTVVYGVNHDKLEAGHTVVSNASCTTNCLAPMAKVLNDSIGIERGYMTTIHAYTGDQRVVDTLHKDPRRARAAALSMIPTSTGAAKAVGLVLPELAGKLDGSAIRVPTPNVSVVDLKFDAAKETSVEEVNGALTAAADGPLAGVLQVVDEPLVSTDYNHNPYSSSIDALSTQVIDGQLVRVMSWYDNEWGFSNRMLDTAVTMASLG